MVRRTLLITALVGLRLALPTGVAAQDSAEVNSLRPAWFTQDTVAHLITLTLETQAGPAGSAGQINGFHNGNIQIVVPLHWTVRWNWRNDDSTASHSLVVMVEREKLPTQGGSPAFTNAMTRMVQAGLKPGQTDQSTFEAEEAGWYWLLCGVPGHALQGEWIGLRVDPAARGITIREVSKSQ